MIVVQDVGNAHGSMEHDTGRLGLEKMLKKEPGTAPAVAMAVRTIDHVDHVPTAVRGDGIPEGRPPRVVQLRKGRGGGQGHPLLSLMYNARRNKKRGIA